MAYFDRSGEASDEAGRWANFSHLPALHLVPGIAFQPITTDSVMTNFVTFEPNAVAEVVRIVVELRDGDPVSELSQTAVAATSGAAVGRVV